MPERPSREELKAMSGLGDLTDGTVRPGGPVSQPVPMPGQNAWPELTPENLAGDWVIRDAQGHTLCQLTLGPANPAGSGALTGHDACAPLKDMARWRYFSTTGQIGFLDEGGQLVRRAPRHGPHAFRLFNASTGWLTLEPA